MNILPRISDVLYHGTIDGLYGNFRTEDESKEFLLKMLEVENLGIQYFIGKQEVANKLIESIRVIS